MNQHQLTLVAQALNPIASSLDLLSAGTFLHVYLQSLYLIQDHSDFYFYTYLLFILHFETGRQGQMYEYKASQATE